MQSLVDRSDGIAVGEYARLRVLAQLTQLYGDLNSVFRRDPEQELTGIALSVADHLFVAARHVLETASPHSLDLVPELISPEAMETGAPVRAVDAFVATGQVLEAIGGTQSAIHNRSTLEATVSIEPRINDRIRASEIRLVGPDGEQVGVVSLPDALRVAQAAGLDLVEVAPTAQPPVCRLMDYGKEKYQASQRAREARKKQSHVVVKEMKFKLAIGPHDYETKKNRVAHFLEGGDKVTIMFKRGRQSARTHLGTKLMNQLSQDVAALAVVEAPPTKDGWNMTMVLAPHRKAV